jgi:hypothetical protein
MKDRNPIEKAASSKKPYVKPRFELEKVFETTALSCGKINITIAQCKFNRKSS